jgi:hypothetical protein
MSGYGASVAGCYGSGGGLVDFTLKRRYCFDYFFASVWELCMELSGEKRTMTIFGKNP